MGLGASRPPPSRKRSSRTNRNGHTQQNTSSQAGPRTHKSNARPPGGCWGPPGLHHLPDTQNCCVGRAAMPGAPALLLIAVLDRACSCRTDSRPPARPCTAPAPCTDPCTLALQCHAQMMRRSILTTAGGEGCCCMGCAGTAASACMPTPHLPPVPGPAGYLLLLLLLAPHTLTPAAALEAPPMPTYCWESLSLSKPASRRTNPAKAPACFCSRNTSIPHSVQTYPGDNTIMGFPRSSMAPTSLSSCPRVVDTPAA